MDDAARTAEPPRPSGHRAASPLTGHAAAAWAGGVLYLLVVLLLIGGSTRAPATVPAVGSLLAATLLIGMVRRQPLPVLALTLVGATAVVLSTSGAAPDRPAVGYQGQFLSYLAADAVLGFVVATCARRAAVVAGAGSFTVQLLVVAAFAHGDNLTVNVVIALLALVAAAAAGLLSRERRDHAAALRSQEVAEAITAERLRIARELHDMVAHSIGIVAIQAGMGRRVIDTQPAAAREALAAIEATSRETLAGLRRTLVSLRRSGPAAADRGSAASNPRREPPAPAPGLADLDRLAAATADAGVRVEVRRSGEQRQLPPELDLSAYRIVQEALTNVVRHAAVDRCRVVVGYGDEELSVEVVDDGRGVRRAPGRNPDQGFGLVGMRERVALLHGRLSVGPRPEGGFRVLARLPLPEPVAVPATAPTKATAAEAAR
ncbi:sensor histidine kinase [Kitasatospora sp. A2-31]|uniref:sensor histidine kinase n=1 Tax=Kitasatospora sp. A2-31 TaxID=2916414 RepID=UPI001EEB18D4|nr:sensor histidine kinase [Kitasatospora sp. A2-31]MCG6495525.1 sensor histidine kinase [Kitasatospora sp. A2-31]